MLIKGHVVTIEGNNLCATITNKGPVLEIQHDCNEEELYYFEIVAVLEKDQVPFEFDPYLNLKVGMLPRDGYGKKSRGLDNLSLNLKERLRIQVRLSAYS